MQELILGTYQAAQSVLPESIRVPGYFLETLDTPFWFGFFRILSAAAAVAVIGGFLALSAHSQERKNVGENSGKAGKEEA